MVKSVIDKNNLFYLDAYRFTQKKKSVNYRKLGKYFK